MVMYKAFRIVTPGCMTGMTALTMPGQSESRMLAITTASCSSSVTQEE
jgi:hypothetical protein